MAGNRKRPPGATNIGDDYRFDDALAAADWKCFERAMARWFAYEGFQVTHRGTGRRKGGIGTDGGVDLILEGKGQRIIVQCKHEKVYQVPYNPVAELAGVLKRERADAGIVVISGQFTKAAVELARINDVRLIDGKRLREMIGPHMSWVLDENRPIPSRPEPVTPMVRTMALPAATQVHEVDASPARMVVRPAALPVPRPMPRGTDVTNRPVPSSRISRRGLRWAALALTTVMAVAAALVVATRPSTPVSSVSVEPISASVETPASPPKPTHKAEKARKPPASDPKHALAAAAASSPRDAAHPASPEVMVYKSADMSDEEFAAWKARKAEREHPLPPPDTAARLPVVESREEPIDAPVDRTTSTPPETMRTILRTNRH